MLAWLKGSSQKGPVVGRQQGTVEVVHCKFWTRREVASDPDSLYVFGDNDAKNGCKGQAVIRGLENAFGVPTKKFPRRDCKAFYSDKELRKNKQNIRRAIKLIVDALESGRYQRLVLPADGLGTGLSELEDRAPKTKRFLDSAITHLVTTSTRGLSSLCAS